jgi:hypothetical protein
MVHVPCIKTTSPLKIYRHLPFPITIPFITKAPNFTILQFLYFQDFCLLKSTYENLFDQDNLDHEQIQEALFIKDTADLLPIYNEWSFQVQTQMDLANCVQRNHVYLCDKQHVVQHDITDTCLGSLYLRMKTESGKL